MFQFQQLSFLTFLTISRWKESLIKMIKVEIIENSLSASHLLLLVPQKGLLQFLVALLSFRSLFFFFFSFFRIWTGSLISFFFFSSVCFVQGFRKITRWESFYVGW